MSSRAPRLPASPDPDVGASPGEFEIVNRELAWLDFNRRVLQEAEDASTPFFERLGFLAIVSSNLDEFFRVRVASLRTVMRLGEARRGRLRHEPGELLARIHETVRVQEEAFAEVFRTEIVPGLARRGIHLVRDVEDPEGTERLDRYYRERIEPLLEPRVVTPGSDVPFLENGRIYLVTPLEVSPDPGVGRCPLCFGIVGVPSAECGRFVTLPARDAGEGCRVLFLEDVIRRHASRLFPDPGSGRTPGRLHAVKLSRDADLHLEEEFEGDLAAAVRRALEKRPCGSPTRFLYDGAMRASSIAGLRRMLGLEPEDLVEGGRYHNLRDLRSFPRCGRGGEEFEAWPVRPDPDLNEAAADPDTPRAVFDTIRRRDRLLHFPYQPFRHVGDFFRAASRDPAVEEIHLSIYRVSSTSPILHALERAAQSGKRVHVFVESKARFDEASNLAWAEALQACGVSITHSFPDLKVHAKIGLVVRREGGSRRRYAFLGTGNFNEETARFYTDWGLLTADRRLTDDIDRLFRYLAGRRRHPRPEHCLVAPFTLRRGLEKAIDREIAEARAGRPASILARMNALEDPDVIEHLRHAAAAGVDIRLLVRGICCLVPGTGPVADRIRIRSIVDRYLEHARVWVFHAGGREDIHLTSADWMTRNLDRRIEVAFPIHDPEARRRILGDLELQWSDNVKARRIGGGRTNERVRPAAGEPEMRAQYLAHFQAGPDGTPRAVDALSRRPNQRPTNPTPS